MFAHKICFLWMIQYSHLENEKQQHIHNRKTSQRAHAASQRTSERTDVLNCCKYLHTSVKLPADTRFLALSLSIIETKLVEENS